MNIVHLLSINKKFVSRDNVYIGDLPLSPEKLYYDLGCSYPRFFKMDKLCKWAWAATEFLFGGNDLSYQGIDKNKIAVVLMTSYGCLDTDKRYYDTISYPSPALFVYTLPNIMLGEISIRHGFKGEQMCLMCDHFDAHELSLIVDDLLANKNMEACLAGWVNITDENYDVCLTWVTK